MLQKEVSQDKKKNKQLKFLLLVVLVLVLLSAILNYQKLLPKNMLNWFDSNEADVLEEGYPYYLSNNSAVDLKAINRSLVLLTDNSVIFLDDRGQERFRSQHDYSSPNLKTGRSQILLFDRGGKEYKILTSSEVVFAGSMEENISTGTLAEDGRFGLVTSSNEGSSKLTIFDRHQKQKAYWTTANEYIIHAAFLEKGDVMAIATISAVETKLQCQVYFLNYDTGEIAATFTYPEMMVVELVPHDSGSLSVVTDQFVSQISKEYVRLDDIGYGGRTLSRCHVTPQGEIAVYLTSYDSPNGEILLLDGQGRSKQTLPVEGEVKWMDVREGTVSLLFSNRLLCYNKKGELAYQENTLNNASRILSWRGQVYILSVSEIAQYKIH